MAVHTQYYYYTMAQIGVQIVCVVCTEYFSFDPPQFLQAKHLADSAPNFLKLFDSSGDTFLTDS